MDEAQDPLPALDADRIGDARQVIFTLAWTHGVISRPDPVDAFVDAASRLADADVAFDHFERPLIELGRRGILDDEQRFALHAAYLHQRPHGV